MVHACRGLRAAKEGLNQTVLLKALREERDSLERRSEEAETELKKIHHSYTDMMTPEVAVGYVRRRYGPRRTIFFRFPSDRPNIS